MIAEIDKADEEGKPCPEYELNVYLYGPQLASRTDWLEFKPAWVDAEETDIAGAPSEHTQQSVANRLKELHGGRYQSTGMTPWRSWAAQLLTLEQHQLEAAIVAGAVPENIMHMLKTPDLAQDIEFNRRMACLNRSSIKSFQEDLVELETAVNNIRHVALALLDQSEIIKRRVSAAQARLETHLVLVTAAEDERRVLAVPPRVAGAAGAMPHQNDDEHNDE
jgi:hypothetical protein